MPQEHTDILQRAQSKDNFEQRTQPYPYNFKEYECKAHGGISGRIPTIVCLGKTSRAGALSWELETCMAETEKEEAEASLEKLKWNLMRLPSLEAWGHNLIDGMSMVMTGWKTRQFSEYSCRVQPVFLEHMVRFMPVSVVLFI